MTRKQIKKDTVTKLYLEEINGKKSKEYVRDVIVKVGFLSKKVASEVPGIQSRDIYTSARVFMHIKEKRLNALEEIIIPNAYSLLCFPSAIYENNRSGENKRGDILLVKELNDEKLLLAILEYQSTGRRKGYHLVTIFIGKTNYLQGRNCIWEKE
jgi:hypothetical protein